jgi:hypothetical protein
MKNAVFLNVTQCGSYEIRRIGEKYRFHHQGDKRAVTRNRSTVGRNIAKVVPSSPIFVNFMMERYVTMKHRFLQEPHRITSQKTATFIVTAVKTSDLT